MNRAFSIHELARRELIEAADKYDAEVAGLGERFAEEIEAGFNLIYQWPEASPVILGQVRRRVVKRFPYNIIYTARPERIRILAIAHHKRRPFYWRGRG